MSLVGRTESAYRSASGAEDWTDHLVTSHITLVKRIVNQLPRDLRDQVNKDDLAGAGMVGLVEAARRFDGSKGAAFSTFAYRRIKGAIMDFLRENDALSKSARVRLKTLRSISEEYKAEHGFKPSVGELAKLSGLSEKAVLTSLEYEKWDRLASLGSGVQNGEGDRALLSSLIPADTPSPEDTVLHNERVELLSRAIEELPEQQKQVVVMYYFEDLCLSEMAKILKVSESRVSQIHTKALYELSRKLEGY